MAKTLKIAYYLLFFIIGTLVLVSVVMLYPWDAMHGGVATIGPLHCEADRIAGSLLSGFKISNLQVQWADLWELGARDVKVRLQPSGLLTGRVAVTGMMSGYTWRARNRQGVVPEISPELRRRLGRLSLKLRCVDGKVICLMGPRPETRIFTVRNSRLSFTGKHLSLQGSMLASGGVPGTFTARVDLNGYLDLELSSRERTVNELVRLFAMDFPWVKRVLRGTGRGDLVYAVTGAPGRRNTAGTVRLKHFTGFLGEQLEARQLDVEVCCIAGQALLKNAQGRLGPVHVASGEGIFSLDADRWKLHSRAMLSSPDENQSWTLTGRPEIVVTGPVSAAAGEIQTAVRLNGENLVFERMSLQSLHGTILGNGGTVRADAVVCRLFDMGAVLDLHGELGEPLGWTLSVPECRISRLAALIRDENMANLVRSVSAAIPLSLKGTLDGRGMASGVDILLPAPLGIGNDQLSLGPGSINVVRGKLDLKNLSLEYDLFSRYRFTTNLFGTFVFDEQCSGQWLLTSSPYEVNCAPGAFSMNGVMTGGGTFDRRGLRVDELILALPDEGKLFLRPFIIDGRAAPELTADLESVSLGPLQSLLPRGIGVTGTMSGNLHVVRGGRKLAGEIVVPHGEIQLPVEKDAWRQWPVAPLYVAVTTEGLDHDSSRISAEAEIQAEESWGTFVLQASLGEQKWWTGEGLLMLSPEKARSLGLNTLSPIFKTDNGGLRLPLRLERGLSVPNMAVNVGQEIGRALVRNPGKLLQSLTP